MKCENVECENILSGYQKKFCSKSCAAKINNIGVRRHGTARKLCKQCGINRVGRNSTKYCSIKCHKDFEYDDYIRRWKSGDISGAERGRGVVSTTIRRYLFESNDNSCSRCGWNEINPYSKTSRPPLQIEHKDGDCTNNRPENLDLLCPNCHSLTPTYGALNTSGNGRRNRGLM